MMGKRHKTVYRLLGYISVLILGTVSEAWAGTSKGFATLYLEMDPTDMEVLFHKEPTDDSTFPVKLIDGDQRLLGKVEVVGKFTRHFYKKSLLIKLDKKGPKWRGQHNKISLRSMSTDLSQMREALGWDLLASLGMVRPQVEHVWLFINNQPIGLYSFIEWITPKVIARFGFGDDGFFFHPDDSIYCGDMNLINQPRLEECFFQLAPKKRDYTPLRDLIEGINQTPVEEFDLFLDKHFYADSVLNWLALNTIIGNGDTYNKNYFIYLSKTTNQWIIIPWDFDLSFGRNSDPGLPFPRNVLNDNYQYFYPPELGASNALKEKTLKNPKLLQRFRNRLSHILGIVPEMAPVSKTDQAKRDAGLFAFIRVVWADLIHNNEDRAKTQNKTAPGFAWFRPDVFDKRVADFENKIRQKIAPERYAGTVGPPFDAQVEAIRIYNQLRHAVLKKMILEPTPFNTVHWYPYLYYPLFTPLDPNVAPTRQSVPLFLTATAEVQPADPPVILMEEFLARPLGIVDIQDLNQSARIRLEVETERVPSSVPPNIDREQCVERSWYFDIKTPGTVMTAHVQVDYLKENSLRHEIGKKVTDENGLSLWAFQDRTWKSLPTFVNTVAKTLRVEDVKLISGETLHMVACQSG